MFHNEKEDIRVRYTRQWVFEALNQLLKEYTIKELTISKVIQKSGVSRATFYRHFSSIEDVVKQQVDEFFKSFHNEMMVEYTSNPPKDERVLIQRFFEKINRNHMLIDVVISLKLDYLMVNEIYNIISFLRNAYYPDVTNNPVAEQYALEMVASSAWTLLSRWHKRGKVESGRMLARIFEQTFKMVSTALFENRQIQDVKE